VAGLCAVVLLFVGVLVAVRLRDTNTSVSVVPSLNSAGGSD
jgi:hypothetical protein